MQIVDPLGVAFGWIRVGDGKVRGREASLAKVPAPMPITSDEWIAFADAYLAALDARASHSAKSCYRMLPTRSSAVSIN
jgi:hypothetical protein